MSNVLSGSFIQKTLAGFGLWWGLFLIPTAVHSETSSSATLQWAANSESDLAGYKVYQGTTAGSYGPSIDVKNGTTYRPSNLQAGLTYFFAITAYDTSGNESPPSEEVRKYIADSSTVSDSGTFPPPILTPVPGATLTSSTVTFIGGQTSVGLEYRLWVGTSVGNNNLHDSGPLGTNSTTMVSGLPTSGTIHVRYWTRTSSGWAYQDHRYIMSDSATFLPLILTPVPGATLTSSTVTFIGGQTSVDLEYWLWVGTSMGSNNLHDSGSLGTNSTTMVSGLPTSGTIHVRYWTRTSSGWANQDHQYIMDVGG